MKYQQPSPGIELRSPIPFPATMIVMLSVTLLQIRERQTDRQRQRQRKIRKVLSLTRKRMNLKSWSINSYRHLSAVQHILRNIYEFFFNPSINKRKSNKIQENHKCMLCEGIDETVNHVISNCSKLAQKEYKTRYDWVGNVIHWELCQRLKFDHTTKCTNQNLSLKMRRIKFSGILRYERIT